MRVGIIAEFNPLHSGHSYLIDCAKQIVGDEGDIVCVMSEYFTQRGEVAIVDGYTRAEEAVKQGIDLVVALPYAASVAFGDDFAKKSVEILQKMEVTHLLFGSEVADITIFDNFFSIENSDDYKNNYRKLVKEGYGHAKIMSMLLDIEENPNFILAYSYYKAIKELNSDIEMIVVEREGQKLNDEKLEKTKHLSATAIRKNKDSSFVESYLSPTMLKKLRDNKELDEGMFYNLLKYKIISLGKEGLKKIYDVKEGLENRIFEKNLLSNSYEELVSNISSKRYSRKRVQRILIHILTNTDESAYKENFNTNIFRVLAVRSEKTKLIRSINNSDNDIELITVLNKSNSHLFTQDVKISRIYNLLKDSGNIFSKRVIIVEE